MYKIKWKGRVTSENYVYMWLEYHITYVKTKLICVWNWIANDLVSKCDEY